MKKRIFWVGSLLIVAGAIGWLAFGGVGEHLVYYWSPTELHDAGAKAYGAVVRLGGLVKPGSVHWKPDATDLRFQVTDGTKTVPVHARSVPPQMFREGIGVVIEGHLSRQNVFESDRLLVKHGNDYKPPPSGHAANLKALMKSVIVEGDER